jgi:nicotinate-nucleotide adenylyltransferase
LKKLIGIFGGTFDPVHYGHLESAAEVLRALALEHIRFLPNNIPPHREAPWLTAEQRQTLLKKAIEPVDGFELDTRELERSGKSYMVDTLASLRSDFPECSFCLIMGMDTFEGLPEWHRWQDLFNLCHLVVTQRPGYHWPTSPELAALESRRVAEPASLKSADAGLILLQSVPQLDISSSDIRQRLQAGLSVQDLVPETVEKALSEMIQA